MTFSGRFEDFWERRSTAAGARGRRALSQT